MGGLSACSHWQGDSAKLAISFGSSDRAIVYDPEDSATHRQLEHRITLTGAAETLNFSFKGATTFETSVTPGKWNIQVESYLGDTLYATGSKDVILKLGRNNETITMHQPIYWWTWDSSAANGNYTSTTKVAITPISDTICDVTVTGDPNPADLNWASQAGRNYTATPGKTYQASWKWKANNKAFKNVTIRYTQGINRDGKDDYLYEHGTNDEKLTIPLSEESKMYQFIMPTNCYTDITFMVGADIGSFRIWDFKVEEVKMVTGNNLAEKLNWLSKNAVNGGSYIVTVNSNETIKSGNWLGYGPDNTYNVTITLTGGTVNLSDGTASMFNVGPNVTLVLENITLNGRSDSNNRLVYVHGTLIMNNGAIINGNTGNEGGGVQLGGKEAYFVMNGGTISNGVSSWGSGVDIWQGTFEMNGGKITGNKGKFGAGVIVNEGAFIMNGGEISGNTATESNGGGVNVNKVGTFTMTGGKIYKNTAEQGGGVNVSGTFTMNGGTIFENTTGNDGGGVKVDGTFTMSGDSVISRNKSGSHGGGVAVYDTGIFKMDNGTISGNTAKGGGGVSVVNGEGATFSMIDGEISGNTATEESWGGGGVKVGGVFNPANTKFTKTGGTIWGYESNNTAKSNVVKVGGTSTNPNNVTNKQDIGHAALVQNHKDASPSYHLLYHRNSTAGPGQKLDSSKSGTTGGWEN